MAEVIINGPEGRLEVRYHDVKNHSAPIALVLHAHPEDGGNMNDKVTHTLYKTFVAEGFKTIRFNFRGVGKSEGKFSHGEGELSDAVSVLEWVQSFNLDATSFWVAGSSFGAWIAMQLLMRRPELEGFIAVSPPAHTYDFTFLAPCPVSGLMIHGDQDKSSATQAINDLAAKLSLQRHIHVSKALIQGADRFFNTKIDYVMVATQQYLAYAMENGRLKGIMPTRLKATG